MKPDGIDYTELADWTESDEANQTPQTSPVFRGADAEKASRKLTGRRTPGETDVRGQGTPPLRQSDDRGRGGG